VAASDSILAVRSHPFRHRAGEAAPEASLRWMRAGIAVTTQSSSNDDDGTMPGMSPIGPGVPRTIPQIRSGNDRDDGSVTITSGLHRETGMSIPNNSARIQGHWRGDSLRR
jgi:hypothetical protein